jgi:signal transduction histidine kinase
VVHNIVSDLTLMYGEKRAEITIESLPDIRGDEPRLSSVFRNLLTNALNYGGKHITVGCLSEQTDARGAFFVRDDGIGIAQRNLEKIFQAGERLKKREVEGVGMGLTFCKKVIMQHQGTIWAESAGEGKGATFYFTIGV